jgi:hypothetical protein
MEIPAAAGSFVKYNGTSPSLPPFGRQAQGNRGFNSYFDGILIARRGG